MPRSVKSSDIDRQVGLSLTLLRKASSKSRSETAAFLGISEQQLGKYERGESSITVALCSRLVGYLQEAAPSPGGFAEHPVAFGIDFARTAELEQALADIDGIMRRVSRGRRAPR